MTATSPAGSVLIQTAQALAPQILTAREAIERDRRLPAPLVRTFAEAGFFRMAIPRSLGGSEVDPLTVARVIEELARADGSAGWCVAVGAQLGFCAALLPEGGAREVFGSDPNVITAGAAAATGRAVAVDGGFRMSGRWAFASGSEHSAWMHGGCVVYDGDSPRLDEHGRPVTRVLYLPRATARSWIPGRSRACVAPAATTSP